ncbi:MAG: hypothetical protein IJY47_03095 [Clostridia bacterium]|nr:hypothetical protein [Clostridia bacterium]
MSNLKIGWSEVSLIPEGKKIDLAGQFYERITDEVESPITVTAMAIECADDCAIFASCDLCSIGSALVRRVRERLSPVMDLPMEKIIISATHVHTGPVYANRSDNSVGSVFSMDALAKLLPDIEYETLVSYDDEDLMDPEECFEFLSEQIATSIRLAWENRVDALYATGFGRAAVGMCRRVCYDDGSAKMWGDTEHANFVELESGNDSGIEMMFTYDPQKKLTGIIANVACPAQVLEHRSIISADYWGKLKKMLREKYGEDLYLLPLCSAAGDQCPRDMVRWVQPETPINDPNIIRDNPTPRDADPSMFDLKGAYTIARRIFNEVCFALEEVTAYCDDSVFEHRSIKLDVPVRRVTIQEYEAAMAALEEFRNQSMGKMNFQDKARLYLHTGTVERYVAQQTIDLKEIEIHVLRLGDIAFATNPYELFLNYGNQIRARSKAKQTFLIQLACGACGYLPTEKAEQGSHYSAYVTSGTAGHEGGDLLVRKTLSEIQDLWCENKN